MRPDLDSARAHLGALFDHPSLDGLSLGLSTKARGFAAEWFPLGEPNAVEQAARYATVTALTTCTYLGVTPQRKALSGRGTATNAGALVGLWADLDRAGEGHKPGKGLPLPPDDDALGGLLEAAAPPPSLLLDSGGGWQAWWLFHEPLILDSDDRHAKAARLAESWNASLQEHSRQLGWHVDGVGDLARLLRVAGTVNRKPTRSAPAFVRLEVFEPELRYSPEELSGWIVEPEPAAPVRARPARTGRQQVSQAVGAPFAISESCGPLSFAAECSWSEILGLFEWERVEDAEREGGRICPTCGRAPERWRHPDASSDTSATACHVLYVFSDRSGLPCRTPLAPGTVLALLNYPNLDTHSAERELARAIRRYVWGAA